MAGVGEPDAEVDDPLPEVLRFASTVDRIALAHLDRNPDWEVHAEIAGRGTALLVRPLLPR